MSYCAAGILPYTIINNRLYCLVGKDIATGTWSDFGGKCEEVDKDNPTNTAIRETFEETLGVVLDIKSLKNRFYHKENVLTISSKTQKGNKYVMYMLEIPFSDDYRSAFRKTLYFLRYKKINRNLVEKSDIQWVAFGDIACARISLRPVFHATIQNNLRVIIDHFSSLTHSPDLF